jgi:phage-related protein
MGLDDGNSFGATATPWCPDIDMAQDNVWRLRVAKFGDGYEQRVLDGINAMSRQWTVNYSNRAASTLWSMSAYLEAQQAGAFLFVDPGMGNGYMVFADEWSIVWDNKPDTGEPRGSLSVVFRKANGMGL